MSLSIIVAVAKNGAIGKGNDLPWRLPADLQYFKKVTLGKPVIMGRKTFDSIGKPLPGRLNIVVSRQASWLAEGVESVTSFEEALKIASNQDNVDEIMLIGGAQLYKAGMPFVDKLYVTEVDIEVDGDAFFPGISPEDWREISRESHAADEKNGLNYHFVEYLRNVTF